MQPGEVPEVVILRLPLYVRALTQLQREGANVASSQQLGDRLQMTPAQIRKDLSYFGRFGKQGRGYSIRFLLDELRDILGLTREWRACLVGVGRLGRAIINYTGFAPEGFAIVAAFDSNDDKVGSLAGELEVRSMEDLPNAVDDLGHFDRRGGGAVAAGPDRHKPDGGERDQGNPQLRAGRAVRSAGGRRAQHRPGAVAPVHDLLPEEHVNSATAGYR